MRSHPTKSFGQAVLAFFLVIGVGGCLLLLPYLLITANEPAGSPAQAKPTSSNFNITISCEGAQLSWPPIYSPPLVYTDADCTERISCSATAVDGLLCFAGYIEGGTDGLEALYVRLPQLYQKVPLAGVIQPVSELGTPLTLEDGSTLLTFTSITVMPPGAASARDKPSASFAFTRNSADVFPSGFTLGMEGVTLEGFSSLLSSDGTGEVTFYLPAVEDGPGDNVRVTGGTIAVTELLTPVDAGDLTLTPSREDIAVVLLP